MEMDESEGGDGGRIARSDLLADDGALLPATLPPTSEAMDTSTDNSRGESAEGSLHAQPEPNICARCQSHSAANASYGYEGAPAGRPLLTFRLSMGRVALLTAAATIGSVYASLLVSCVTHTEEIARLHEHCEPNGTGRRGGGGGFILPSASYGIGVFQPQCFLFIAAIVPHAFARVFEMNFFYAYYKQFTDSPHYNKCFYRYHSLPILYIWDIMEMYGLVSLTLVNIEEQFPLHAFGYFCWVWGFCGVCCNHPFLYYGTGLSQCGRKRKLIYWLRIASFPLAVLISATSGILYYFYHNHCSPPVYNAFTSVEYCVASMNAAYHVLNYFDHPDVQMAAFAYVPQHTPISYAESMRIKAAHGRRRRLAQSAGEDK